MPEPKATVSAVVVVRNGERFVGGALDSIAAQSRPPDEVIVVDGESTDRTRDIVGERPWARLVAQVGRGLGPARNQGIAHTTGDLVAFLDHDDRWSPAKTERQMRLMTAEPALAYVTTRLRRRLVEGHDEVFAGLDGTVADGSTPSTLMVRRWALERIGGFDAELRIGGDADWFARARDLGLPTRELDEVLVEKLLHSGNLSIDGARNGREMLEVVRRSLARRRLGGSGIAPPPDC